jgi:hypothetical protein
MKSEFADFLDTIFKLRYEHDSVDLNRRISALEPGAKTSEIFLIKMEIKRLAQPCQRLIDLREVSKSVCEQTIKGGVTHYLDYASGEDFDEELKKYKGVYCSGVYEFVTEQASIRAKTETSVITKQLLPEPQHLSLSDMFQRGHERLYFVSKILVYFTHPGSEEAKISNSRPLENIAASTSDISLDGVSFKVPEETSRPFNKFFIRFVGLEEVYSFKEPLYVGFNFLKSRVKGEQLQIAATLDKQQNDEFIVQYQTLVNSCFANHKRRNRVSVENTVRAVNAKIHEQFVASNLNGIPVFCRAKDDLWVPVATLDTDGNDNLASFMLDAQKQSILPAFIAMKSMQANLASSNTFVATFFLLRFKGKNNSLNFACFDYQTAIHNQPIWQLVRKGLAKSGVRIIRVYGCAIDPLEGFHRPSSLPDSVGEAFANMNRAPSAKLTKLVATHKRMCVMYDLSDTARELALSDLDSTGFDSKALNIRDYLLLVNAELQKPYRCESTVGDLRMEDRFDISVEVKVWNRKESAENALTGTSINASTRGLRINCPGAEHFTENDDVFVNLKINKGKTPIILHKQRYKIVRVDWKELYLAINGDVASHDARIALRDIIYSNLGTLLSVDSNDPVYGYSRAVRNLFSSYHMNIRALTVKSDGEHYVRSIINSTKSLVPSLNSGLSSDDELNLLSMNLEFRKLLFKHVLALTPEKPRSEFHFFVVVRKKRNSSDVSIIIREFADVASFEDIVRLYHNLSNFGKPTLLRLSVCQTSAFYDRHIRDELRYLLRYAKTKHSQCVQLLKESTSIVEFQDLSDLLPPPPQRQSVLM